MTKRKWKFMWILCGVFRCFFPLKAKQGHAKAFACYLISLWAKGTSRSITIKQHKVKNLYTVIW